MLKEIESHPRVAALTRNPLMLVIVALIRHHQLRLPERRVELYQLAVRMLLDTWNRLRSEPGIDRGGTRLPLERLLPVWGRVAEWIRREQPTGFVHRADLQRKLIEVLEEDEEEEPP
jgi:predicted NACHT family NTPase